MIRLGASKTRRLLNGFLSTQPDHSDVLEKET